MEKAVAWAPSYRNQKIEIYSNDSKDHNILKKVYLY